MKIFWGILAICVIVTVFLLMKPANAPSLPLQSRTASPQPQVEQTVDFTATFIIITNGTTRNFSAAMYHNRSADVYIEAANPTVVHIKKAGVTWNDFFQTLPFSLTKECLTTGTQETFCTGETGTLRFYLNDIESPNLLDTQIKADDHARIQFIK